MTHPFTYEYFNGGHAQAGGYAFYRDFFRSATITDDVDRNKMKSVLEIGCGRGYILRKLEARGIRTVGLDISEYCFLTRASRNVRIYDIRDTPWPFKDQEFDLCLSVDVMDMLSADELDRVVSEVRRVSKFSGHTIRFAVPDPLLHMGRKTNLTLEEWRSILGKGVVDTSVYEAGALIHDYNTGVVKMNLGCGANMFRSGWMNADIIDHATLAKSELYRFQNGDVRGEWASRADGTTAVCMLNVLHELDLDEIFRLFDQLWRVMMAGAILRVSVPDPEKVTELFASGRIRHILPEPMKGASLASSLEFFCRGKSPWTRRHLVAALEAKKFGKVLATSPFESQSEFVSKVAVEGSPETSATVECRKLTL